MNKTKDTLLKILGQLQSNQQQIRCLLQELLQLNARITALEKEIKEIQNGR